MRGFLRGFGFGILVYIATLITIEIVPFLTSNLPIFSDIIGAIILGGILFKLLWKKHATSFWGVLTGIVVSGIITWTYAFVTGARVFKLL